MEHSFKCLTVIIKVEGAWTWVIRWLLPRILRDGPDLGDTAVYKGNRVTGELFYETGGSMKTSGAGELWWTVLSSHPSLKDTKQALIYSTPFYIFDIFMYVHMHIQYMYLSTHLVVFLPLWDTFYKSPHVSSIWMMNFPSFCWGYIFSLPLTL